MRLLRAVFCLLSCIPSLLFAATVTATWTAPTTCADGSPISNCPITKYTVYAGLSGSAKTVIGTTAANVTGFSAVTGPGNWCLQVSASSTGGESALSSEACIVVPVPAPGKPSAPTLTLTVMAPFVYDSIKSQDTLALLPVGSVPLGTACDVTQGVIKSGITYFVVPMATVTLTGTVKPLAVVAQCS